MLTLNPATMHAEAPHSKTKVLWVDLWAWRLGVQ
jgi:hypothetical protein